MRLHFVSAIAILTGAAGAQVDVVYSNISSTAGD